MNEIKQMVSVLIPCYNHEKFVADCLKSILNQRYSNYEVIICDDKSDDRSVDVIWEQKKLFDEQNIRFVVQKNESNLGITRTINRMLPEARGEFIKLIASDDMLMEDYMSDMVVLLNKNPTIQFAFSNCIKVQEDSIYPVTQNKMIVPLLQQFPDYKNNVFERVYLNTFIPAPTLIFRKSVLMEMGGYDESIGIEDLEMCLRILSKYPNGIGALEKSSVYYRCNSNSISSVQKNKGLRKRGYFMYVNSRAIAKKYRRQVSRKVYYKRMFRLFVAYCGILRQSILSH